MPVKTISRRLLPERRSSPQSGTGKAMIESSLPPQSQGQLGRSATASKSALYHGVRVIILAYIVRMKRRHGSRGKGERKPEQRKILRLVILELSFNVSYETNLIFSVHSL